MLASHFVLFRLTERDEHNFSMEFDLLGGVNVYKALVNVLVHVLYVFNIL